VHCWFDDESVVQLVKPVQATASTQPEPHALQQPWQGERSPRHTAVHHHSAPTPNTRDFARRMGLEDLYDSIRANDRPTA
jgi:hypothetical protein